MIEPDLLRRLRNDLPMQATIAALGREGPPSKMSEGYFRFLCPHCGEMRATVNPRNNLAHCFYCNKNINNIDLLITLDYSLPRCRRPPRTLPQRAPSQATQREITRQPLTIGSMNLPAKFAAQIRQQLRPPFGPVPLVAKFVAQIRQHPRHRSAPPTDSTCFSNRPDHTAPRSQIRRANLVTNATRILAANRLALFSKILNNSAKRPAQPQNPYTFNSATTATTIWPGTKFVAQIW